MDEFFVNYVLIKESQGVLREISLTRIEAKFGLEFRQQVETLLTGGE